MKYKISSNLLIFILYIIDLDTLRKEIKQMHFCGNFCTTFTKIC